MVQTKISNNKKALEIAKNQYFKLQKPKTCDLETYINIYTNHILSEKTANKKIKAIDIDNPPKKYAAQVEFIKIYPPDILNEIKNKIYNTPAINRAKVWKELNIPVDTLEQKFINAIEARIKIAQSKGYKKYIDMFLEKYGISQKEYLYFKKSIKNTIEYCNQNLPKNDNLPDWFYSNFNLPCFICRQKDFPIKDTKEVLNYFIGKYPLIKKFRNKIKIEIGEVSKMSYQYKIDSFLITLAKKANKRHRIVDLIHELSHVLWYLEMLTKNKNPYQTGLYQRELGATQIEFKNLNIISERMYQGQMAEVLLTLRRVLFEIELYNKSEQNLSKLYAKSFNICFKDAKQKYNPTYLLDDKLIMNPFYNLPHAISDTIAISNL